MDRLDNRNSELIERLLPYVDRFVVPYHRATVEGLERVPQGAALLVGNHNGGTLSIDSFILGSALHGAGGTAWLPYGLAHDLVCDLAPFNKMLAPLGAVRANATNARRLFEAGAKVLVYPGGDVDAMRPYRQRNLVKFAGRTGFVRLALANQVPIVPVVAEGAHGTFIVLHDFEGFARAIRADRYLRVGVWPLALSMPWGLTFGPSIPYFPFPAKIRIRLLEPIEFGLPPSAADDPEIVARCADRVRNTMQWELAEMAAQRR